MSHRSHVDGADERGGPALPQALSSVLSNPLASAISIFHRHVHVHIRIRIHIHLERNGRLGPLHLAPAGIQTVELILLETWSRSRVE